MIKNRSIKFLYIGIILCFTNQNLLAQQSADYTYLSKVMQEANVLYHDGLYQSAATVYDDVLSKYKPYEEEHIKSELAFAGIRKALANLYLHPNLGVGALQKAIIDYTPHPIVNEAHFALGDYHYNRKNYKASIASYDNLNWDYFTKEDRSEGIFKQSYCHFVSKHFKQSLSGFNKIAKQGNSYYYEALYYSGMSSYFTNDFDDAAKQFEKLKNHPQYKKDIPNYLAQIYFARTEYDKVISYGERAIKQRGVSKLTTLHQLIGQAYYQKGNYEKALPHLVAYEADTDKLTAEEFYQLAITHHNLGKYEESVPYFREISSLDNEIGINANFYLADAYIKTGDKNSAQSAFRNLQALDIPRDRKDEMQFNYAKISADQGNSSEAITALSKIPKTSAYYKESQALMINLLSSTEDHEAVIKALANLKPLNGELKDIYQKTYYSRAIQNYSDEKYEQAENDFIEALQHPINQELNASSSFWLAHIEADKGDYKRSNKSYGEYLLTSKGLPSTPSVNTFLANYNMAYNYVELGDKRKSLEHFDKTTSIGRKEPKGKSSAIYSDALIRSADLYFEEKDLQTAFKRYKSYTKLKSIGGKDYATYQMATISGLSGETFDQLVLLEDLVDTYPDSEYTDDALVDIGNSYIKLGKNDEARNTFLKIINGFKQSSLLNQAYLKLGLLSYNQGDFPKASEYYQTVFDNNPSPKEADQAMAALEEIYVDDLARPNDYVKIVKEIDGYEIEESDKDSLVYRTAEIQFKNGKYEAAIKAYNDYLREYPKGKHILPVHYGRAQSLTKLKNYSAALSDYEVIVEKGPSQYYEDAIEKAAIITYLNEKDFEKSLKYNMLLESISKDEKKIKRSQYFALRSAHHLDKTELINAYAQKIIANDLTEIDELSFAHYALGKEYYRQNKYAEASKNFEEVITTSKAEIAAESRYLIAEIHYRKKRLDLAEQMCKQANNVISGYPFWVAKSVLLLSDIYIDKDDLYNAKAALEVIVENYKVQDEIPAEAKRKLGLVDNMIKNQNRIIDRTNSETLQLIDNGN